MITYSCPHISHFIMYHISEAHYLLLFNKVIIYEISLVLYGKPRSRPLYDICRTIHGLFLSCVIRYKQKIYIYIYIDIYIYIYIYDVKYLTSFIFHISYFIEDEIAVSHNVQELLHK